MRSIDEIFELAWKGVLPTQFEIKFIMQKAIEIFSKEDNSGSLKAVITVRQSR